MTLTKLLADERAPDDISLTKVARTSEKEIVRLEAFLERFWGALSRREPCGAGRPAEALQGRKRSACRGALPRRASGALSRSRLLPRGASGALPRGISALSRQGHSGQIDQFVSVTLVKRPFRHRHFRLKTMSSASILSAAQQGLTRTLERLRFLKSKQRRT